MIRKPASTRAISGSDVAPGLAPPSSDHQNGVMPAEQLIFWGAAKALATELTKIAGRSLTQRALTVLGKQPRQRALAQVLEETYRELAASEPKYTSMLFDEHFLRGAAAPVLARILVPGPSPAPDELVRAWHAQFSAESTSHDAELLALASRFIAEFERGLRSRDELRPFFDSNALDAVRDDLRAIRTHLEAPPDLVHDGDHPISDRFSEPIRARFAELDAVVERLTDEQYRLMKVLGRRRRALISGCAGSGKTLIAADKALRIADANYSTLFLCHSPLLAEWVVSLTAGKVHVTTVEQLVRDVIGDAPSSGGARPGWSNYSGPTADDLGHAFDVIVDHGPRWDAIIVDEGQDFVSEWWTLVEACLSHPDESLLYVFFDEAQSLIPFRAGDYPIDEDPIDLSRNCRNGGQVLTLMRELMPDTPEAEPALVGHGRVLIQGQADDIGEAVGAALTWLDDMHVLDGCVALLGGGVAFEESVLAARTFRVGRGMAWRQAVEREFSDSVVRWYTRADKERAKDAVHNLMRALGRGDVPSESDITLVQATARRLQSLGWGPTRDLRQLRWSSQPDDHSVAPRLRPAPGSGVRIITRTGTKVITPAEVLGFFASDEWARSFQSPREFRFESRASLAPPTTGVLQVHTVGEFKGLEAQAVFLLMQGSAPEPAKELFVGVSRARAVLAVVIDDVTARLVPDMERHIRRLERRAMRPRA